MNSEKLTMPRSTQRVALLIILLLGLLLRLKGIDNPIIDHPGWRQGDEAAIARNFALVDGNILHPLADYNGPGPNYVELELQIVPYLASLGYHIFGVHEVFGRLISMIASLSTVWVLFAFGRWFFFSPLAGLTSALLFAIAPGSIYYGRTFQPDTVMTLFFTWALYIGTRSILEDEERAWLNSIFTTVLVMIAILAKFVAAIVFLPLIAVSVGRYGLLRTITRPQNWLILLGSLIPFWLYDRAERSIATWKWASGITTLHVLPSLKLSLESPQALYNKLAMATTALPMLAHTMLGPIIFTLLILGFLTPLRSRSALLLVAWLGAAVAYIFVVFTVERVDYYLYPLIPLASLVGGAYLGAAVDGMRWNNQSPRVRIIAAVSLALALAVTISTNRQEISGYYDYNHLLVHEAQTISRQIPPKALVVIGHLDPSTMYYLNRRGWQEDPMQWSVFNEQSAINKGARYFIAVEPDRLKRNVELAAWLERFPKLVTPQNMWTVYLTDPRKTLPGAEDRWQAFRKREREAKYLHPDIDESTYVAPEPANSAPHPRHNVRNHSGAKPNAHPHDKSKAAHKTSGTLPKNLGVLSKAKAQHAQQQSHDFDQNTVEPGTSKIDQL